MNKFLLCLFIILSATALQAQEVKDEMEEERAEQPGDSLTESNVPDSLAAVPDSTDKNDRKARRAARKAEKLKDPKPPRIKLPPDTIPRPVIGASFGVTAFNGDVKSNENSGLGLTGNFGVNISVSQKLNQSFDLGLEFMLANVSSNERSIERNLNFKSQIFTSGLNIRYNFNALLPKTRSFSPFIGVGIENISFTSKADLIDRYGNTYHYWSDGSIRSRSENAPDADESILLTRDYVYETDIRSQNYDGKGNYDERALGIPLSIGGSIMLTSKIEFGMVYTYHFTFTDDIDGVNNTSTGDRIGNRLPNNRNDHFWYLGATLRYNFTRSATGKGEIRDDWSPQELMAFGTDDYDGDGVYDFMDECPQTPFGVEVTERGCPLNPERPVALTDSQIYERYLSYIDSTGLYTKIEKRAFSSTDKRRLNFKRGKRSFKIKLGEFVGGVPQDVTNSLLGLPDVETHVFGDTTVFTVGGYDNLPEAIQRKIKVAIEGFEDAEIVMQDERGRIVGLGDESGNLDVSGADYEPNYLNPFIFRVQLGAFKSKKPDDAFRNVQNLVVVENEQGFTKYMSGAFENYADASKHRVEMIGEGWGGAFVVAYKRGQGHRLTMEEAGVTEEDVKEAQAVISGEKLPEKTVEPTEPAKPAEPAFDKSRIKFKIQIGIYKNQVPPDVLSEYMKLNNLAEIQVDQSSAAKRYTSGEFSDYQSAVEYRNKLIQKGFETAFIIALKDGEVVSIEEARRLMGDLD